ncbi:MAG: hypothetical protein PHQ75_04845 [Thermoguttaceae bacterium]|nr:hypothetical protein [Thermoguttaceae bacterium]
MNAIAHKSLICSICGILLICLSANEALFSQTASSPKRIAPGVMRTIRPFVNYSETYQWSSMPEIVGHDSSYDWARDLFFNKEVWCLEFSFKPVRMIEVDFPTDKGTMEKKLVWYMVYSVTNTGKALRNEIEVSGDTSVTVIGRSSAGKIETQKFEKINNNIDGTYRPVTVDYLSQKAGADGKVPGTRRFLPQFVLASPSVADRINYKKDKEDFLFSTAPDSHEVVYYDEFLPVAFVKIATKEDPNQKFYPSVQIATVDLKPGDTVWGIATWIDLERQTEELKKQNVDPRIDKFSIYISGLTNALRWEDSPAAYKPDAQPLTGRSILRKVLKLNFSSPGDEFDQNEKEVHFGQPGELDYQWIYM